MNQALCAHMNNKRKRKKKKTLSISFVRLKDFLISISHLTKKKKGSSIYTKPNKQIMKANFIQCFPGRLLF
jgi:hypothetical protein